MFWPQLMLPLFYLLNQNLCFDLPVQDCWTAEYDFLFVYDCRDEKRFLFQYKFISDLQEYFSHNSFIKFFLGTLVEDGIKVRKRFSETSYNNFFIQMANEVDCSSELSVDDIFDATREAFDEGRQGAKKLAFVILYAELSGLKIDEGFPEQIKLLQEEDKEIQRIFIILGNFDKFIMKTNFLYSNQENFLFSDVIQLICDACRLDTFPYTGPDQSIKKCYLFGNSSIRSTGRKAEETCGRAFRLISFHYQGYQEEYKYLSSAIHEKLRKLRILKAEVFIKDIVKYLIDVEIHNSTNIHLDCTLWSLMYSQSLNKSLSVPSLMSDSSIKDNAPTYTEQFLKLDCGELRDNIQLCEIELSTRKKLISVYELAYETVVIEEMTLIPKDYLMWMISSMFTGLMYDDVFLNRPSSLLNVKQIICPTNQDSGSICQHVQMCYSDNNYRQSFCDGPVQYIYTHHLVTEFYNYITFNTSGQNMDHSHSSKYNKQNKERNNELHSNKSLQFHDYLLFDEKDVHICSSTHTNLGCIYYLNQICSHHYKDSDCSKLVCPANFLKCPNSECVFLGDEKWGVTTCENLKYLNVIYSGHLVSTVEVRSSLKRICTNINFLNYITDFHLKIESDFVCEEGFKCLSGNIKNITDNQTSYIFNTVNQTVGIFKSLDKYKIEAQKVPLLSLLEHLELRAPHCYIDNMYEYFREWDISQLIILDLSFNNLKSKDFIFICSMKILRYLNVSHNLYLKILEKTRFPILLETFDLSETNVDMIPQPAFKNLDKLKYLHLRQTKISQFYSIGLPSYFSLNILDLRETCLHQIKSDYFQGLSIQSALFVDDYKLCCPQVTGPNIPQEKCYAPPGPLLSSCKDLIGDSNKRIVLWFVGIVAFIGNLFVVVYRLVWDKEILKKSYGLFVTGLGVSDLIMRIYLIVVAAADSHFRSLYVVNDTRWRYGNICKFAGFLATFSSESSAFFICLITVDRYLIMRYPFGEHRFSNLGKTCAAVIAWSISFVLALIPTLPHDWDIYSSNSMCLALPLNIVAHNGWLYSFCVLILLNFITFLIIFLGQILVFIWFSKNKMPKNSMIPNSRSNDISIAKNLAFVAISDFLCWFPIAIMGFMSLGGYMFGNEAYSWSAVFVIPINSALNPIIYTLPAVTRKIRSTHIY